MGAFVYLLCAAAALSCAVLLYRAYRASGARLLFWSTLCFAVLTINNVLLVVDLFLVPHIDLFPLRNASALTATCLLLYGLVWEAK